MRLTRLRDAARMPTKGWTIAATILVLALASVPVALGKDGDVIRRGSCTAASDWKLKLSPENGQIEVEFEVDQNKVGDTWRVVMRRNGAIFFQGNRVTKAPSGSFDRRSVPRFCHGHVLGQRTPPQQECEGLGPVEPLAPERAFLVILGTVPAGPARAAQSSAAPGPAHL